MLALTNLAEIRSMLICARIYVLHTHDEGRTRTFGYKDIYVFILS